jgi:hypothetical protein
MQWRRGLAFAAVHLAVAIPIVASLEAGDAAIWRDHSYRTASPGKTQLVAVALIQDTDLP